MTILLIVNVILIVFFVITSFFYIKIYLTKMLFDISNLIKLFIFIIPISLSIVNSVMLFIFTNYNFLLGFIPIIIPCLYFIFSFSSDYFGEKIYNQFKKNINDLYEFTVMNDLNIQKEDFIIRIRNKKRVSIIINVYSNDEEKKVKELRKDLLNLVKNKNPKYEIEILVDKKKDQNKYTNNKLIFI